MDQSRYVMWNIIETPTKWIKRFFLWTLNLSFEVWIMIFKILIKHAEYAYTYKFILFYEYPVKLFKYHTY